MPPLADTDPGVSAPRDNPVEAPWHALDAGAVAERLGSPADGLDIAEAAARLARFGPTA